MKTYIGICMLVIVSSILVAMYLRSNLLGLFKVKDEKKYDMFVRWFLVLEVLVMIVTFYCFADYSKAPEAVVPAQDSVKIWVNDKDTLAVDSLNKK